MSTAADEIAEGVRLALSEIFAALADGGVSEELVRALLRRRNLLNPHQPAAQFARSVLDAVSGRIIQEASEQMRLHGSGPPEAQPAQDDQNRKH